MSELPPIEPRPAAPDRRGFLAVAGALGLGALASPRALAAPVLAPPAPFTRSDFTPEGICSITPGSIEGPFYLPSLVLKDITGGKPGLPFIMAMQIVRASDCSKIAGAEVDLWQADAKGVYSGFASQGTAGQTWLRGTQVTNGKGLVGFNTIYPGLYPGRTAHFHIKVRPQPGTELTAQLYFDDVVTALVHQYIAPYNENPPTQTLNQNDGFFTPQTVVTLQILQAPLGLLGTLIVGVNV
jgi:protocatechuate 3,4-dioxygenase beta subunit